MTTALCPTGLANVEEIAAVEGIDGIFVGPADLGLRIGHAQTSETLATAIQKVAPFPPSTAPPAVPDSSLKRWPMLIAPRA